MGQKLNPTIFRLGINKTWKTEFFEKKNNELPLYVFKDLETRSYIKRFFETNGIFVHDYKQHYNTSTLNLYISYFIRPDFFMSNQKNNEQLIIIKNVKKNLNIKRMLNKNRSSYTILSDRVLGHLLLQKSSTFYKTKHYLRFYCSYFTKDFVKYLVRYSKDKDFDRFLDKPTTQFEGYFAKFFSVLNLFMGNRLNIVVNFYCINKTVQSLKPLLSSSFISFQKFKSTSFFKEGIELLVNVTYNSSSSNLLAEFIAFQLKKIKRQKFFLSFLKQALSVLVTSNLSKIKGVKIVLKGRLNGVPRARHKIITIGDIPIQTILTKIDYCQTTFHNSSGSYGTKVWIVEK